MDSSKKECENIIFHHVSIVAEIILLFKDVGEGGKKNGERQEKFDQIAIVPHYVEAGKRNGDGITQNERYQENDHSPPIFNRKYHQQRNKKQYIFYVVNVENIPEAQFVVQPKL